MLLERFLVLLESPCTWIRQQLLDLGSVLPVNAEAAFLDNLDVPINGVLESTIGFEYEWTRQPTHNAKFLGILRRFVVAATNIPGFPRLVAHLMRNLLNGKMK